MERAEFPAYELYCVLAGGRKNICDLTSSKRYLPIDCNLITLPMTAHNLQTDGEQRHLVNVLAEYLYLTYDYIQAQLRLMQPVQNAI